MKLELVRQAWDGAQSTCRLESYPLGEEVLFEAAPGAKLLLGCQGINGGRSLVGPEQLRAWQGR